MSKRGGHGGAWKVAYADFVTAMMALFMVLWIVASSQEIKQGIAGYFRSTSLVQQEKKAIGTLAPITTMTKTQPTPMPQTPTSASDLGGDPDSQDRDSDSKGPDEGASGLKWSYRILAVQQILKESLRHEVAALQKLLARNNLEISDADEFRFEFMSDGMRIQALDRDQQPLFESGTANLTPHGEWVLKNIAYEMERFPFRIEVEGHVTKSSNGKTPEDIIDPWDLSTRRAISAQQFLTSKQIPASQFFRIAGMADRVPLDPNFPEDPANRRITLTFRLDPTVDFDAVKRAFQTPK